MRYLLLIYGPERPVDVEIPPEEMKAEMDAYTAFSTEVHERRVFEGGEALEPTPTATTVRVRDNDTLVTDGPFAETKEQLGGYYLLDCRDLDEAIELAAKIPGAKRGSIEIRPIWEIPEDYQPAAVGETAGAARQGG